MIHHLTLLMHLTLVMCFSEFLLVADTGQVCSYILFIVEMLLTLYAARQQYQFESCAWFFTLGI